MESRLLPIPKDLPLYEYQVAGHGYSQKCDRNLTRTKPQLLHSPSERCIYKPVQAPPKGDREIQFYRDVFDNSVADSPELAELRHFLPAFSGVLLDGATGQRYLRLGDLLADFVQPSVMDLKMGARSYEPDAPEWKRAIELAKYGHRDKVGFLVTGLQAWRQDKQAYEYLGKRHWAKVTPDQLQSAVMPPFLSSVPRGAHRRRAVRELLAKLRQMLAWFERQNLYHFYASSVLLAVESCPAALDDVSSGASSLDDAVPLTFPTSTQRELCATIDTALSPRRATASDDSPSSTPQATQRAAAGDDSPSSRLQATQQAAGDDSPSSPHQPDTEELSSDASSEASSSGHSSSLPNSRCFIDHCLNSENSSYSNGRAPIALAAMIDFTHAVPGNGCLDENFLIGLRTLVDLLENYRPDE